MNIDIRRLTPDLVEDYLHFFDQTPHSTNRAEHRCYCVCWSNENDENRDFSTAGKRRHQAVELVTGGHIQGYLAYVDGQVVGWCNANTKADCYGCISWRMFMGAVPREENVCNGKDAPCGENDSIVKCAPAVRVKSVFCFAIAPELRGKGIAGALLKRVCEDAAMDGFDVVEAYPNKAFVDTEQDFMGPAALYEKYGFAVCCEVEQRLVMRRNLQQKPTGMGT